MVRNIGIVVAVDQYGNKTEDVVSVGPIIHVTMNQRRKSAIKCGL